MPTIDQLLEQALAAHQAGRLHEAEQAYRAVLQQQPNHPGAMHLLGVIAHQVGRNDVALELISHAVKVEPNSPAIYGNLGVVLESLGRSNEAINCWQRAIQLKPDYAEALDNLGRALEKIGRLDESVACWRRTVEVRPDHPESWNNLGVLLARQNHYDQAAPCFEKAIALRDAYAEAHANVSHTYRELGRFADAEKSARRALELKPDQPISHRALGEALRCQGKFDEATVCYRKCIELKGDDADAWNSLGNACKDLADFPNAQAAYEKAIALQPGNGEFISNRATVAQDQNKLDEALGLFNRAVNLQPDHPGLHLNRSLALLMTGRLTEGWVDYRFRSKCPQFKFLHRTFAKPRWDGSELGHRRILLFAEQGFGDALNFVRYVPMVIKRGGRVILECQAPLKPLMTAVQGVGAVVVQGWPLPDYDVQASLLDLPEIFGTTLDTIPAHVPYIPVEAAKSAFWKKRLADYGGTFKVGLVWAGSPRHDNDRRRSIRLERLAPLGPIPGVTFFSLQKGEPAGQSANPPAGMKLIDWSEDLKDFSDAGGLVANLDLVLAVDTAVVHLAGAMARPVWTLVPFSPDWRWLLDREDSPWYPTMRLFRQPRPGDWDGVIARVAAELAKAAGSSLGTPIS